MTDTLFPELVAVEFPPDSYFVVAYWPRDKRWAIKSDLEYEHNAQKVAHELNLKGWQHITIFRLQLAGPWAKT